MISYGLLRTQKHINFHQTPNVGIHALCSSKSASFLLTPYKENVLSIRSQISREGKLYLFILQILKLYAWEMSFKDKISAIRNIELKILKKAAIYGIGFTFSWTVSPYLVNN